MTDIKAALALVEQMAIHAGDNIVFRDGAIALKQAARELRECRNELCLRCGSYKTAHLGSCNGCKWWMP